MAQYMRITIAAPCLLLLLFTLLVPLPVAWAKPDILGARIGQHPGKTRFVLELSQPVPYRVFTLPDPFRVVIDLPQFGWKLSDVQTPRRGGLITGLRHGPFAPGTGRVVLDMAAPVVLESIFMLPAGNGRPNRFVVDIKRVSRTAYFATPQRQPVTSAVPLAPPKDALAGTVPTGPPDDPRPVIVVDAGHGGVDPGAKGVSGIYEKELTLQYAQALKAALLSTGRYRVVLTRADDRFVELRDRIRIAEKGKGDLLISLHANNHDSPKIRGASVYTLSEKASDKEAGRLAAAENAADALAGVELGEQSGEVRGILIDLAQRESMNLSKQFANTLVMKVGQVAKLLRNTHRFAGFAVLKSPNVPSILLEIGYLSNRKEEREMRRLSYRNKVVGSIIKAIDDYFAWQKTVSRT